MELTQRVESYELLHYAIARKYQTKMKVAGIGKRCSLMFYYNR
jgi:hypothetical protein